MEGSPSTIFAAAKTLKVDNEPDGPYRYFGGGTDVSPPTVPPKLVSRPGAVTTYVVPGGSSPDQSICAEKIDLTPQPSLLNPSLVNDHGYTLSPTSLSGVDESDVDAALVADQGPSASLPPVSPKSTKPSTKTEEDSTLDPKLEMLKEADFMRRIGSHPVCIIITTRTPLFSQCILMCRYMCRISAASCLFQFYSLCLPISSSTNYYDRYFQAA